MYATADGGICSPMVNPPHTEVEYYCGNVLLCGHLDTGADSMRLTHRDADMLGISRNRLRYDVEVSGSTGTGMAAIVTLPEVVIGPIRVRNVEALIMRQCRRNYGLVGRSFLNRIGGFRQITDRGEVLGMVLYP